MLVSPQTIEASLIARRLGEWGAQTCVLSDIEAALALLPERMWHAVIVDHAIPAADMQRIGDAARQHAGRSIVMIAPADRHELAALKQLGYGDYLVKPLRPASLAARLGARRIFSLDRARRGIRIRTGTGRTAGRNGRCRCWSPRTTRSMRC